MISNDKWLTVTQTMYYTQCKSKATVYTLAKKYNIRQTKLLSMVYFSREDIDRIMGDNAVQMGIAV